MMNTIVRVKNDNEKTGKKALENTINKFKNIMIYVWAALIIKYTFIDSVFGLNYSSFDEKFYGFISECLLLHLYVPIENINTPLWYLSALILVYPVLFFIGKKYEDFFSNILCVTLSVFIYSYLIMNYQTIGVVMDRCGFTNVGVMRAAAGLCTGVIIYGLASFLRSRARGKKSKIFSLVELVIIFIMFGLMTNHRYIHGKMDVYIIFAIFLLLIFAFSQTTYANYLFNQIKLPWADWSMAIFVSHMEYAINMEKLLPNGTTGQRIGVYFFFIFTTAGVVILISEFIKKYIAS